MGEDFTQQEDTTVARAEMIRQARRRGVPEFFPAELAPENTDSSSTSENPVIQKAYLEQLLDCAPEALIVVDKQQQITRVNSEFTRVFGFTAEEAIGRSIDTLIVPADRYSETRLILQKAVAGEKVTLESKRQRKDGSIVDVFISCAPVIVSGKPVAAYCLYRDISEHKRNEEALQRSEARFRSLVQSAVYGIGWLGASGKFLDANPALIAMLGHATAQEVMALDLADEIFIDGLECKRLTKELQSGRLSNVETRWKRKDGSPIVVRLSGCAVDKPGEAEPIIEIIVEDITERRVLEEQFRQAQKMEAVGRLAGGVAHDFNNLLTVIRGYTEVLLESTAHDNQLHSKAEAIQQAAERATVLTRQLLAFSRKQLLELKPIDLNVIVTGLEQLMSPLIGKNIELSSQLSSDLGNARADAGQMEQVIMNLMVNAKDAMPNGGKISIGTSNVVLGDEIRRVHNYIQPGPYVMLTVSDNGHGMDEETRASIFEPFFTTKEKGKGTGLGLFTVYGIIKQSRGYIFAESEAGVGTTFRVYLPRVEDAADAHRPMQVLKASSGGSETVLLVEDEVSVRELVRETLEKKGYKVLEADKGDAALKIAAAHQGRIDILISDVVMPGMSGPELCSQLVPAHPGIKVLYVSGYTEDAIIHQGVLQRGTAFLQKPFSLQALSRKVREVLHPTK